MQKRKMCRKGVGRALMIIVFYLALSYGRSSAGDTWERGMGRVIFPRREHPAAFDRHAGYLLVSATAANPFSIPGLCESTVFLSVVRAGWSGNIRWEHAGIAGYSQDLLETSAGLGLPGGLFHLYLIVRTDSRSVTGYGRETDVSTSCAVSAGSSSAVAFEMESGVVSGEGRARATFRAGRDGTFLLLTIGRDGRGNSILRAGGAVRLAGRTLFLAGYDIGTGEVSGGISFLAHVRTAVSWSIHPVLGATFSVSAGAVR
jgi:hypothetical protein